jgi:hypothetical protein
MKRTPAVVRGRTSAGVSFHDIARIRPPEAFRNVRPHSLRTAFGGAGLPGIATAHPGTGRYPYLAWGVASAH